MRRAKFHMCIFMNENTSLSIDRNMETLLLRGARAVLKSPFTSLRCGTRAEVDSRHRCLFSTPQPSALFISRSYNFHDSRKGVERLDIWECFCFVFLFFLGVFSTRLAACSSPSLSFKHNAVFYGSGTSRVCSIITCVNAKLVLTSCG